MLFRAKTHMNTITKYECDSVAMFKRKTQESTKSRSVSTKMSDDIPERDEFVRSTIISVVLTSIFFILGILFYIWTQPDVESILTGLYESNPILISLLEIIFMVLAFLFLTVTIVNIRLFMTQIRAGWLDIILILALMLVITYLMFGAEVTAATLVGDLGIITYLYLLQD